MIGKSKEVFMHFSLIFVIGLSLISAGCWKDELTLSAIIDTTVSETSEAVTVNAPSAMTMITASPGSDPTPEIQVSGIETGYTVKIYSDSDCSTSVVGSATSSGTSVNVTLSTSLTPDGSYTFYSTATDTDSNISDCSVASAGYTLDTTSPATPSLTLSDPASTPGNDDTPAFEVTGVVIGDTIKIYTDVDCTVLKGSKVATATTENVVSSALADASYTFYANSTDSAGNVSGCSGVGAAYVLDTVASATPSLTLSDPASTPGNDTTPAFEVTGVVIGDTIKIYTDVDCTVLKGSKVATATTENVTSSALADASYTFYANTTDPVGNVSGCSAVGAAYVLDTTASATPSLTLSDPASTPGNDTTPAFEITGVVIGDTIRIYTDIDCTVLKGSKIATATTENVTSSALADASYTFYANSTDPVGNVSGCSSVGAAYVLDTVASATPSLTLSDPASTPGNDDTPAFEVTGVIIGDTIRIYTDAGCTILKGSKVATATTENVTSSALADASYTFYANSTDPVGNVSGCSTGANYTVDTAAPAAPTALSLIDPATSPGNDKTPDILVSGVVDGNTVFLHSNATCTATLKSGLSTGATISITTDELADADYTIYANTTDPAGNVSACSATSVSYSLDTGAPSAPTALTLIDPATSPGNDPSLEIQISGVVSSDTVVLYSDVSCTATVQSGIAAGTTINLITPDLSEISYTFYAKSTDTASNSSTCSTASVSYTLDITAPATPSLTLSDPASTPGNDTTPAFEVTGVVIGDTIKIYTDAGCTVLKGSKVATATTENVTSSALADASYTFYANSTDPVGNVSGCSTGANYTVDTAAPAAPTALSLIDPATSPGNDKTPEILVSGVVDGNTVFLHSNASCTATMQSGLSSGATISITTNELADNDYTIYANTIDPAGNISACSATSVSYSLDTAAPAVPTALTLIDPATSPGNDPSLEIQISGVESSDTVVLYSDVSCTATVQSGIASGITINLITPDLSEISYTFYAKSTDTASNSSTCSTASVSYTLDITAPATPSLTLSDPASSPGNDTTPAFEVTDVTSGDTISIYTDSNCTTLKGSTTSTGVTASVTSSALTVDATYTFYANSTDPAGNISVCSVAGATYALDTTAPSTPSLTLHDPSSTPWYDSTPTFKITSIIAGDTIKIYTDSNCTTEKGSNVAADVTDYVTSSAVADGAYTFYANSTDPVGNISGCSSGANYTYIDVFSGGSGTLADPFLIANAADMQDVDGVSGTGCNYCDKHFKVVANIDMSVYTGEQFNIIGNNVNLFSGSFDGNGFTIDNFTYTTTSSIDYVGLFGITDITATMTEMILTNVNVASAGNNIGGLVGINQGSITGSEVTGNVEGNTAVGGLIGDNYPDGSIDNCSATIPAGMEINGGGDQVGGLIGHNSGSVTNSNVTITGTVGSNSYYVGGLIGYNSGTVENCSASGDGIIFSTSHTVGGLVGRNNSGGSVTGSEVTGINIDGNSKIGGLIGWNIAGANSINNCSVTIPATMEINAGNNGIVGGLIGMNEATSDITNCDVTVTGTIASSASYTGGLIGDDNNAGSTISNCHVTVTGTITAVNGYVSGLLGGINSGTIENSSVSGSGIIFSTSNNVSGLVYKNEGGTIRYSYTDISISGGAYLGGLVADGNHNTSATIENCHARGNITGNSASYSGGLLGGYVRNTTVTNSYFSGTIMAQKSGGIIGFDNTGNTFNNVFWDRDKNAYLVADCPGAEGGILCDAFGQFPDEGVNITGITSKTTTEMQTESTFTDASWDFYTTPIWKTADSNYPILAWQPPAPSLSLYDPASSPGTDDTPTLKISGLTVGDTIKIFSDSNCTTLTGSKVATAITDYVTSSSVSEGANTFYVNSTDPLENVSGCSSGVEYVLDTVVPATPSLTLSDPVSTPGNDTTPTFEVTDVVDGDTINIYTDSNCTTLTGTTLATSATAYVTSSALADASYTIYANSIDAAENVSGCSVVGAAYELDATAPATPSLTRYEPVTETGTDSTPAFEVTNLTVDDTIKLYTNSDCTNLKDSKVATAVTDYVTSSALADDSYTFYVNSTDPVGNISGCSSGVAYSLDTTAPATPALTLSDPASTPGNDDTPAFEVTGVVIGDTVKIYTDVDCTVLSGSKVATATTENVTSSALADDSYTFYANSTDSFGNISGCSGVGAAYVLDTVASATPSLTLSDPASTPGNDTTPAFEVTSVVIGDTIKIYTDSNCTTEKGSKVATATTENVTSSALADASYTFYANSIDPAGNISGCSGSGADYVLDTTAPATPSLTLHDPSSTPGYDGTPTFEVTSLTIGDTIKLYTDDTCTTLKGTNVAAAVTDYVTSSALADGAYTFYVNSTDDANNISGCSSGANYTYIDLFSGGSGTAADPFLIATATDMQTIDGIPGTGCDYCDKHFKVVANIDMSAYTGEEFNIIGDLNNRFSGSFDGNGYTIDNFTYTTTASLNYVGLFGFTDVTATITAMALTNVNISSAGYPVGGLVGTNLGEITGSNVSGNVEADFYAGGLVGSNESGGTISNCSATVPAGAKINDTGTTGGVGGLIGANSGSVTTSNVTVTGSVSSYYSTGGLVGVNAGTIENCSVGGDGIILATTNSAGGLAGRNSGSITDSNVTGMNTSGTSRVGGLIGYNIPSAGNITNCNVTITGTITSSSSNVGGFIGDSNDSIISNCHVTVTGTIIGNSKVSGFLGDTNSGTIENCSVTGSGTIFSSGQYVSGLVHKNNGIIRKSYTDISITGENMYLGGLVSDGDSTGGTIENCYVLGNITSSSAFTHGGGLVGGGFIANTTITDSYFSGTIDAEISGGIVGYDNGTGGNSYSNVFWDKDKNSLLIASCTGAEGGALCDGTGSYNPDGKNLDGITSKTTTDMQFKYTFTSAGWDFTTPIWKMPGGDYPILEWQPSYCTAERIADAPYANYTVGPTGDGLSEATAYTICTPTQFQQIGQTSGDWDKHFILKDDIDLDGVSCDTIGINGDAFSGNFNGGGLAIDNFNYNNAFWDYAGLFGVTSGVVRNLILENVTMIGRDFVGGLVGRSEGEITNCRIDSGSIEGGSNVGGLIGISLADVSISHTASVNITNSSAGDYYGGLIGITSTGTVSDCSSITATVTGNSKVGGLIGYINADAVNVLRSHSTVDISSGGACGGLIGSIHSDNSPVIENCYATGDITSTGGANGGFIGGSGDATIQNCYSTGNVESTNIAVGGFSGSTGNGSSFINCYSTATIINGSDYEGGFIGLAGASTYSNCYWQNGVAGIDDAYDDYTGDIAGITSTSSASMKSAATFSGWDFVDIWTTLGDTVAPLLWWQ